MKVSRKLFAHGILRLTAAAALAISAAGFGAVSGQEPFPAPSAPRPELKKQGDATPTEPRTLTFTEALGESFEKGYDVVLKRTMEMMDERDSCIAYQCRSIPAGEAVSIASPTVLNVVGRDEIKVRYRGKTCYIAANQLALEFTTRSSAVAPGRLRNGAKRLQKLVKGVY